MEETILTAGKRDRKGGKFREQGYIAGVIYGDKAGASNPVKFKSSDLHQILKSHGRNARVTVLYDNTKKLGFIKEIQKDPLSQQITHVDVQVVSRDQEVKLQVPLIFSGEEELSARQLLLMVVKPEVTVLGTMDAVPEAIAVDVAQLNAGDSITVGNLTIDPQLKVSEREDVVFASINYMPVQPAEEEEEEKPVEAEAE